MRSALRPVRRVPAGDADRYRAAGLWTGETFPAFVADRTVRFADRTAVVGVDATDAAVRWTYRELAAAADAAWAGLVDAGARPGDRVVVALPNVVELVAVVIGSLRHGAVPVLASPTHRDLELAQICEVADAAAVVVESEPGGPDRAALHEAVCARLTAARPVLVDVAVAPHGTVPHGTVPHGTVPHGTVPHRTVRETRDAAHETNDASDIALLQLSGGTTGTAKLIPRTHDDYLFSVRASAEICGLTEDSVMLVSLPAGHNFALSSPGILGVLHVGGTVVLARDPSPGTAFRLVESERVTLAALVPPLAQAWISSARRRRPDLSSLDVLQVGGSRLADHVAAQVGPVLGAHLQQVFGMAEGLVCYTRLDDPAELVETTQGRPISPFDEVVVVDDDDRPVPPGDEGHLLTRGPYTIRGYYGAPQADADCFTADGFYRTGDLVRARPSGHLVVTGRDKDQINRAGEKVPTEEVEGLALTHADVLDAVAVGVPDPFLGERTVLVVRLEPDTQVPDLRTYLADAGLATHKIPDDVVVLPCFPATHVGKSSRRELRRLLADDLTTGAHR